MRPSHAAWTTDAELCEVEDSIARLVNAESPSGDASAVAACADVVAELGERLLGDVPERLTSNGRPALRWTWGEPPYILLLAHCDTVWPMGEIARRPFTVDGDILRGPGVLDMKAGLAQGLHALAGLPDRSGIELLVTADEEIGSVDSRELILESVGRARAGLILEFSADISTLKTARAGVMSYTVEIAGKGSHVGLAPDDGVSALTELAFQVLGLAQLSAPSRGTRVTAVGADVSGPGGSVPDTATLRLDIRTRNQAESARVRDALATVRPVLPGAQITVEQRFSRPPFAASASAALFALAQSLAGRDLTATEVGGSSDGNFVAAAGVPTLDGVGAVGSGAHTAEEHVDRSAIIPRIELLQRLLRAIPAVEQPFAASQPKGARA